MEVDTRYILEVLTPKSLPVALITPTTAAKSSTQKFSARANTTPDNTIRNEPAKRIRRLPTRSATKVRSTDRSTSPSNVRLKNKPICESENLRAEKKTARRRDCAP
jgi:hypothetical protein